ncbi:hypothetical protein BDQ17DRAFT_1406255 [Cyathus striatus]|nr:hypothetical protein BDQ17DRAFT_1406255 [Cyathus striatus]
MPIRNEPDAAEPPKASRNEAGKKRKTSFQQAILRIPEDLRPPSRPQPTFVLFRTDWREANSHKALKGNILKEACSAWEALSNEEKKLYKERTMKNHAEYRRKLQEWVDSVHPDVIHYLNSFREARKFGIRVKRSDGLALPDPPFIAFQNGKFRTDYVKQHGKVGMDTLLVFTQAATEAWKALSESEREMHQERYKKMKQKYFVRLEKLKLRNLPPGFENEKPQT